MKQADVRHLLLAQVEMNQEPLMNGMMTNEVGKNKFKDFDDVLKDLELEVRDEQTTTPDSRIPVVEEIIYRKKKGEKSKRQFSILSPILVRKLAQIAVEVLDEIDSDNHKRVVLNVINHIEEVINGTIYNKLIVTVSTQIQATSNRSIIKLPSTRWATRTAPKNQPWNPTA